MSEIRYHAEYHRVERSWYLWNGHNAIRDERGEIRFFLTAQAAYDWLSTTSAS